jgi:RNA polymerase sigma factor (sigma-70 family)
VAQASYGTTLRHIHALFSVGTIGGLTDGQRLERFTSCDKEAAGLAFGALVERHGPMVLRVCQSVLRERYDAEDAFQATFLILVRKAASIRNQNSVVSWLHGVAFRVASCQKGATARRRRHEWTVAGQAAASAEAEYQDEHTSVLHDELNRLPDKYRAPLVLCYFEGLSHEQAARQLRWPVGTVRSRLARGRDQLRSRLTRRGLPSSIVLLAKGPCAQTASAAISPALATATAHAALRYASGRFVATGITSTSVALLMEGAMNVMFLAKMKFALLACGLVATGALVVAQQVGTVIPGAEAQAASAGAIESHSSPSVAVDDDAIVAHELDQLDLDLLAEEVQQLRERVEVKLRDKLRAERKNSGAAEVAQSALEAARASYLAKARELKIAQRRSGSVTERRERGPHGSISPSTPVANRVVRGPSASTPGPGPSAAAIGSIDIDAVFARYEKLKVSNKDFSAALLARKNELMSIMAKAQDEAKMLSKLTPGSGDYKSHENNVTELKARYEAGRDQSERAFAVREARMVAAHYQEIQETVAALAKTKGLTYVVKVSQGPRPESSPTDVDTALKSSVVYADRRNDLTEEVIRDLNCRFEAGETNISK